MDDVLSRLKELYGASRSDSTSALRAESELFEAQHLWKTVETLVATLKPQELCVKHGAFAKLLACVDAELLRPKSPVVSTGNRTAFEIANRVLVKIGCRGEDEREAILREAIVVHLMQVLKEEELNLIPSEVAVGLHVFQTLAVDTKRRLELFQRDVVPVVTAAMCRYPHEMQVQVFGCRFLQYMAYEEATKERIIQRQGVEVLLQALDVCGSNVQLACSALDALFFLSIDLDAVLSHNESKFMEAMESIVQRVAAVMQRHEQVEQLQTHGVAILLTFCGPHAVARRALCKYELWRIARSAFDANEDAAADTVEILSAIFEDAECFDLLTTLVATDTEPDAVTARIESLVALKTTLETKGGRVDQSLKGLMFILDRLQTLVDSARRTINVSSTEHLGNDPRSASQSSRQPLHALFSQRAVSTSSSHEGDDSQRFLDQDSPTRDSRYGGFDEFVRDSANVAALDDKPPSLPRQTSADPRRPLGEGVVSPVRKDVEWQQEYANLKKQMRELEGEYNLLQENYKIVVRRAQEQSRLLNIQSGRIRHHMEVHQHALNRVRSLETALADAQRKHQVERELRLAEVAQSEKISLSLHEAMKEIKTLNKQNSNTARELEQREKLRVDFQQKATVIKQQQQQLAYERDDAVIQMMTMRTAQEELNRQLQDSRREASEALRMREEDVDAPRPSAFSEFLSLSPRDRVRRVSNYTLTTKRVKAEANARQMHRKSMYAGSYNRIVRPVDASIMRKASILGSSGQGRGAKSANLMVVDGDFDDEQAYEDYDDSVMQSPKEDLDCVTSSLQRNGLDKIEIERTLRAMYESFEKSPDGNGVHLATIRRFFGECGIVQPPLVPGDVDTILTRVLNQAQESRNRVMIRKDFTVTTFPGGIGSSMSSYNKAKEPKRLRFFDEESFFEAVTLLVMRRFPRFEAKKALEVFITDYLFPMQRHLQQQELLSQRRSSAGSSSVPTRSASFGSNTGSGGGNRSPTAACIGILKAVLNGLALHVTSGDDPVRNREDPRFLSKQGDGSDSILLATSTHSMRKHKREDVVYSMLEMHAVLAREYKPLATICEFYSTMHHTPRDVLLRHDTGMPLSFELVLTFAMDFEIIPSFMDRLSLKQLYSEVSGYVKTYLTLQKKNMLAPHAIDTEMLKKVAFSMLIARLAMELFSAKCEYETPEKQITALLQWIDNSVGREKVQKKAMLPIVIKFSRTLYALRS